MQFRSLAVRVGMILMLMSGGVATLAARAWADPLPRLVLREVKITGSEFVVLANNGPASITQLSDYWLGYVGNDDSKITAPPVQQLPDRPLGPGQALLLSGGGTMDVCDASYVASLSPSLSDTKGTITLWQQAGTSFSELPGADQQVRWNKSTSTLTLPAGEIDLKKETTQYANPVWYYGTSGWIPTDFSSCGLTAYASASDNTGTQVVAWPVNDTDPPAVIENLLDNHSGAAGPYLPLQDVGLLPPQITELLPNPLGTGTDGTDEFIELYNPNALAFSLSGFILQTGLTTKHGYTFPAGTMLPPKAFVAFYAADTGLSLSNTTGQSDLEDPFGTVISQTDSYGTAKDGQAWALAKGNWYWTSKPTPSAANIINQSATSSIRTTSAKKAAGAVKGASTTTAALQGSGSTANSMGNTANSAPVHPYILVAVAIIAVGYGLYEYRHDVANRLDQFRKYRAARRAGRS